MLENKYCGISQKAGVRSALLVLLWSIPLLSYGQFSISGRVTNQHQGLPGAYVLLLGMDSAFVKGLVTDTVGEFSFENVTRKHYIITVRMIGYAHYYSQPVAAESSDIVLPDIILKEDSALLEEIVVKGERELFEQGMNKSVINVENSASSSGNTILEILQKSPGVVVNRQDNTIRINGRAGVTVMINGKPMPSSSNAAIQMLEGMNAANIEKIELITAAEAKYDAEGSGGIVNIVTKEPSDMGTNGSVEFTAGANWAETLRGNFSLSHRRKTFSCFADYSITRSHNLHILRTERYSREGQTITASSRRENITTQQNLRVDLEWRFNSKTSLNFGTTAYRRNWSLSADADEANYMADDSSIITRMHVGESNIWQSVTGSVGLYQKVNEHSEFRASLDYLYYNNNNPSQYQVDSFYEEQGLHENYTIDVAKSTPIHFLVSRADYHNEESPSFTWDAGLKAVYSVLNNDVSVRRREAGEWITDPMFSSSSILDESIYAAYVSTKWQVSKQVDINTGLRYELTHTSISSPIQKDLINRKYGYFFPNFSLRKTLAAEKDIQLSYSRRITRPGYNDIAPYVFFWGPHSFSAGNTTLYPAVADAIGASYHRKQWTFLLHVTHSRNEISSLQPEQDAQSNLIYRSQNLKFLNTIAITNSYSTNLRSWWDIQGTFTAQYQRAKSSQLAVTTNTELFGWNFSLINRLTLPKDFSVEISLLYQSRTISGISEFLPMGSLNAGIKKNFGKKGVLQLSMDDILYTNYWRIKTQSPANGLDTYFRYDWHNQYIRLTYTRNFGKVKGKPHESRAVEESGRVK